MILLCSQISVLPNHQQRSSLQQQICTDTETHSLILCSRNKLYPRLGTSSNKVLPPNSGTSYGSSTQTHESMGAIRTQTTIYIEEEVEKLKSWRGWGTPGVQGLLNPLSKKLMSSQRRKQQAQSLHWPSQVLCVCIIAIRLVFLQES